MGLGRLRQVNPHASVKADAVGLAPRVTQNRSPEVPEPDSCSVENRVFSIIPHAVGNYKVKVFLKLIQGSVQVGLQLPPHGGKIHWVGNEFQVIWNLNI